MSFILLGTFVSLNAFVGVICAHLQHLDDEDDLLKIQRQLTRLEARLEALAGPARPGPGKS